MNLDTAAASISRNASTDETYDFIVCGMGYAGAIMTVRLAERNPDAKILAIEYGGHVQSKTGGGTMADSDIHWQADMFQKMGMIKEAEDGKYSKYDPEAPLTMPDVPGNYNNVAFRPMSMNGYSLPEFRACFQGIGLGGNSVYNGALYQEPANWFWDDDEVHKDIFLSAEQKAQGVKPSEVLKPYFDLVRKELKNAIKTTPSMDGIHYNHGLYDLVKPYLDKAGFNEIEYDHEKPGDYPTTGQMELAGDRFYTVPTVNAKEGLRTGASAWLEKIIDEDGQVRPEFPNVTIQTYTEVLKVNLGNDNEVTGVDVLENPPGAKFGGRTTRKATKKTFSVTEGGKVIVCCNALPTNRILYRSGVGPEAVRSTVMPSSKMPFKVNNEGVGTTVNEHITTSLGFKFKGDDKPQPNTVHFGDSKDWVGHSEHLSNYARFRTGPFAQFGPVVASHFRADMSRCAKLMGAPVPGPNVDSSKLVKYDEGLDDGNVTTELFYNPFGSGPYPPSNNPGLNPYNGPGTYTVYVMLLRPESRSFFKLDEDDNAVYTTLYMNLGAAPEEKDRKALKLPNYDEFAKKDIATMCASIHEVLEITKDAEDIEIVLGPGDKHTQGVTASKRMIANLDPKKIQDVYEYVTFYDKSEWHVNTVNGEYLAITRLEENHYHSTVPLARNLDVFGEDLGSRKDSYGLDPDTCEVKGTKGLCVVDASMFPKVVYCHPIGAVMALAEWAADKISPVEE